MVLDAEIFGLLRHLADGIRISADDLAVEAIGEVGPGGNFLAEDHTLTHMRERGRPHVFGRGTWEGWEAAGRPGPAGRLPALPGPAAENVRTPALTHVGQRVILGEEIAARADLTDGFDREVVRGDANPVREVAEQPEDLRVEDHLVCLL